MVRGWIWYEGGVLVPGGHNYLSVVNKQAATWPDASDKFMTEATSMARATYWPLLAETFELFVGMIVNSMWMWIHWHLGKVVEKIGTLKVVRLYLYLLTQLIQLLQLPQQSHNLLVWFHFVCGNKRTLKVHFFTINEHKQYKLISTLFDNFNVSEKWCDCKCFIILVHSVLQYILQCPPSPSPKTKTWLPMTSKILKEQLASLFPQMNFNYVTFLDVPISFAVVLT